MPIVAGTQLTYTSVGIREDLADTIYRISPEETPLLSNSQKGALESTYFEWLNDALAAPTTADTVVEGDDAAFSSPAEAVRLGNYAQISRKTAFVAGTNDAAVKKAGRRSEMAYQVAKRSAELKRDMEAMLLGTSPGVAGGTAVVRRTAGLEAFLRTNTQLGASGVNSTLSGGASGFPNSTRTDGTQRAWTETLLRTAHGQVYSAGGSADMLMVGPAQKQVTSTFAGLALNRRDTGDKAITIVGAADVYIGDFGAISLVPNRFQRNRTAFLLDSEHVSIDFLRPFQVSDLATTGDAKRKLILAEYGLRVTHEAAHAAIYDLT